jgi:hypothetical protein
MSMTLLITVARTNMKPPTNLGNEIVLSSCATLVSICFDWIMTSPDIEALEPHGQTYEGWVMMHLEFFRLRFPQLKALQFRNHVVQDTAQPEGLYLLDRLQVKLTPRDDCSAPSLEERDLCLEFMEAHANLQSLAWPMDAFYSGNPPDSSLAKRIEAVVDNLGRTLVDLRVDTLFRSHGEPKTDNVRCTNIPARQRRRCFIEKFASKMTKVESIKIEGGVPRDERKEIIRALHACPLEKIVMIGVSCPGITTIDAQPRETLLTIREIQSVTPGALLGETWVSWALAQI